MKIERLQEPELRFKDGTSTYSKNGLSDSGPYAAIRDGHSNRITLGIVGTKDLIERTSEWVSLCNDSIESTPHGDKEIINKDLFPNFPGFDIAFDSKLVVEDSFIQHIKFSDLAKLKSLNNIEYTDTLLNIFHEKIRLMLESAGDAKPSVILCVITEEMYDIGHIAGNYHKKLKRKKKVDPNQLNLFKDLDTYSESDFTFGEEPFYRNFRSAMKKMAMSSQVNIPIQILREPTIDPDDPTTQNAATKAWNFCTGVYYKAGNHPWILKNIDPGTCYLGISFYHKKDHYNDDVYTSMAHLFANDFEDIILRGKKVNFDDSLGAPYLDYEKSKDLLEYGLGVFEKLKESKPKRLVIHKTSGFREDEIKGFSEVLEEKGIMYDLVNLTKSSLRLLRWGTMPVPRGSMFSIDKDSHFLYTKGYIPELQTYPGVHVPAPFQVVKARGESSQKEICREILALTKLNWNTADFCCGLPITIGFSRNVGQVLKEFDEKDAEDPAMSYRFYM